MDQNEAVVFPEDLGALSLEDLQSLQGQALAAFDALAADENIDDAGVEQLEQLATGIERVTTSINESKTAASSRKAAFATAKEKVGKLRPTVAPEEVETVPADTSAAAGKMAPPFKPGSKKGKNDEEDEDESYEGESEQAAAAVTAGGAKTRQRPSLAKAQANAPVIPANSGEDLVITAAAPTSNVQIGSRFESMDDLVAAVTTHAKSLVITEGRPGFQTVASIKNTFDEIIDGDRTSLSEFEAMVGRLRSPEKMEDLVAAGGWCAPSEIKYDFFNIACQDGMIDLPTFGVQRGGIQFPVSPSLADVYSGAFTNATNPWLWQEIDDIAAATGTGGNPSKPCVRVICPTFDERRLECYGICLTAGNLTESAYPEAVRNHLSLLLSAHFHAMNKRFIDTMVLLSTAATTVTGACTGILADAPATAALAAQDYRSKYGMCDDDVLEVIFPRWVKDAMRIDHLRRTGFWENVLTDADINALFTRFRLRVQWVGDWQVRSAGFPGNETAITDWPATATFMIYAAGTFVKGNGLTLDLGVVRDAVLTATNDHTAAWTEECHLIARYGHESRLYTICVCVAGRTGAADIVCADV